MSSKWVLFRFASVFSLTIWGQNLQPIQTRAINLPFTFGNTTPLGNWSGGAIITVENSRSSAPIVRAFDREGHKIAEFTLSIPGASLIKIHSGQFVRGFDGSFAIAGHAYTTDSRGASFVAWVSADGKYQSVIRMSPYLVYSIAMAADGTIWTVGGIETKQTSDYDLVRRFDRSGKLLSSIIPQSSLNVMDTKRFVDPASNSYLASSATNVAWYSEAAQIYILFGLDGAEIARITTVTPDGNMLVHGLALCDDGRAFIGAQIHGTPSGEATKTGVLSINAGGLLSFTSFGQATLYGCDGSSLVAQGTKSTFFWYGLSETH